MINEIVNCDISKTSVGYLNHRRIIFLPKKGENSVKVTDYRLISLLEFLYKIISKTLSKKIEMHLPSLVGPNQFGFVSTRRMSTASCSAFAMAHEISRSGRGLLLCLDISKAFDSI